MTLRRATVLLMLCAGGLLTIGAAILSTLSDISVWIPGVVGILLITIGLLVAF